MADKNTLAVIAEEVAHSFWPLSGSFASEDSLRDFLTEFGWEFDIAPTPVSDLRGVIEDVTAFIDGKIVENDEVTELLIAENAAFAAIADLKNITSLPTDFRNQFPRELIDYLLVDLLLERQARWGHILSLLGLLRLELISPTATRLGYTRRVLLIGQIGELLKDPIEYLRQSYQWGESEFEGQRFVFTLSDALEAWGVKTRTTLLAPEYLAEFNADALSGDEVFQSALRLILFETFSEPSLSAGAGLFLLPETSTEKPGLALLPWLSGGAGAEFPLGENLTMRFRGAGELAGGVGVFARPGKELEGVVGLGAGSPSLLTAELRIAVEYAQATSPMLILGHREGSRLEFGGVSVELGTKFDSSGTAEAFVEFALQGGKIVIQPAAGESDSFLGELLPSEGFSIDFDLVPGFSSRKGLYFNGSGGFEVQLASQQSFGPIEIEEATLRVKFEDGELPIDLTATVAANLSVVRAVVANVGLRAAFSIPEGRDGNLGAVDLALQFKPPNGVGISLDTGPVSGGGYLFFDKPKYFGALELNVFVVNVKAFGLIETELPGGEEGFSFVVVISAEFTPIQLGFGFTLLGVGGIVGINRTMNTDALGTAARTGSLAHLLFPKNVVADAPAIIHDLATIFPAAKGHFIFGPMAKLGWGTPALITADIGIILELPGVVLALVGIVRVQLPKPDAAILSLQMGVAGILDFPAKKVSIDTGLFDSQVVGFPITGDMAFRLGFGKNARFLVSVGGFNPTFAPPPAFPTLRALSISLGVNGNPSLVASGYFAVTSNSAQAGAGIELRASGFGIRLHGKLGFDVLFIFSPFSFAASIEASMRVSFHGAGFGITLRGDLSGPSPWNIKGKVCVSVLWWDACLKVNVTFGKKKRVALPEMNPWEGRPSGDPALEVVGLEAAIQDTRNWSGGQLPAAFSVVTLAGSGDSERIPIDPMGPAKLVQKVLPLGKLLEKFGEYKPTEIDQFNLTRVDVGGDEDVDTTPVTDEFAPAHFENLGKAEKLSRASYESMDAGFSVAPDRVKLGPSGSQVVTYETKYVQATGELINDPPYTVTEEQLVAQLRKASSGVRGVRVSGLKKYVPVNQPKKVSLSLPRFAIFHACSQERNEALTPADVPQSIAHLRLRQHLRNNPQDRGLYRVAPVRLVAAA